MATNYLAFCALCTLFVRLCMHTRLCAVYVHCSRQQAICAEASSFFFFWMRRRERENGRHKEAKRVEEENEMEIEDSEMKILRVVFVFVYKYIKPKKWNSKTGMMRRWEMSVWAKLSAIGVFRCVFVWNTELDIYRKRESEMHKDNVQQQHQRQANEYKKETLSIDFDSICFEL